MSGESESTIWAEDLTGWQVEEAWSLVSGAFRRLDGRSVLRQCPTRDEFEDLVACKDVFKIINVEGSAVTQLSTFHTTPDSVPWVDRGHLNDSFRDEIALGVFGYVGITASLGSSHKHGFEHIFRMAEEAERRQNAVDRPCRVGFDYSSRNRALPRMLLYYLKKDYPHFSVVDFTAMNYSLVDPSIVDELLSLGATVVDPEAQNEAVRSALLAKHHLPDGSPLIRHHVGFEGVDGAFTIESSLYGGVVADTINASFLTSI